MADGANTIPPVDQALPEHSLVRLTAPVISDGVEWPTGTKGAIVHVFEGGAAYLVEVSDPSAEIVTVVSNKLAPA